MKIIQMIIEKHYNRMLRMFKAFNEAHIKQTPQVKASLNNFFYNKMNTDIKQGS